MLQFHCYDILESDNFTLDYDERFINNLNLFKDKSFIKLVENILLFSEEEMLKLASVWVNDGFEGLMIRSRHSLYDFGRRSIALLKVKFFESEEFKINNVYLAENDNTKVMFLLENHHTTLEPYNKFDCSVKGNKEYNMVYYNNKEQYIDKWCTVSYQALSSYFVPLFAQVEAIRDGEHTESIFIPNY